MRTAVRPGDSRDHDPSCTWPQGYPCKRFSTDGTRVGAYIAHSMGTMDEDEIARMRIEESDIERPLTGMPEEQADWEEG